MLTGAVGRRQPLRRAVALLVVLSWAAAAAAAEAPCESSRLLLRAGLLDAARESLRPVEGGSADETECLAELSDEIARRYREQGDALLEIGAVEQAQAAYVAAVSLRPALSQDLEGRADPFGTVRELAALGEIAAARTKLQELLAVQPPRQVPDDLLYLHGGRWARWRELRESALEVLPTLAEIVTTALVLVLAVLVLVLAIFLIPRLWSRIARSFQRKLMIGAIEDGGEAALAGAGFAAALRSQIFDLARSDPGRRTFLVTAAPESVDIPEVVGQTSPAAASLSALVGQLAKHVVLEPYVLSGAQLAPGRHGPGVTLHFLRGHEVLATATLWQGSYVRPGEEDGKGEKASYYLLAELAAAWALFQLKREGNNPFSLLGTADWQAFALFHAGERAFEQDEAGRASYCFERALDLDGDFHAARLNLARVFYESDRRAAREHMEKGLAVLIGEVERPVAGPPLPWPQLWQRLEQVREGTAPPRHRKAPEMPGYLMDVWYYRAEYSLLGLLVGEAVVEWRKNRHRLGNDTLELQDRLHHELRRFSEHLLLASGAAGRKRRRRSGEAESALQLTLRWMAAALQPVAVAFESLVESKPDPARLQALRERSDEGSARFSYNLACLFSLEAERRGEAEGDLVDLAVQCLLRVSAFEPFRQRQIATDPLLVHLVSTAKYGLVFGGGAAATETPAVGELELIGETMGRALGTRGIRSLEALLLATARRAARQVLAVELGISEALVLRWALLAELCRIEGLGPAAMNLLERAGHGSLAALAGSHLPSLATLLASLREVLGGGPAVEPEELAGWVEAAARHQPSMVEP